MRLLIVGTLQGQLTTATKIAMDRGASVTHAETIDQSLAVLRSGRGADLMMVEVSLDISDLVARLDLEHIHVPIVACGIENNARAAVSICSFRALSTDRLRPSRNAFAPRTPSE